MHAIFYNTYMKKNLHCKKNPHSTEIFGELIGLIISILIAIYLMPKLPFVTDSYPTWLPITITTSILNTCFHIGKYLSKRPLVHAFEALSNLTSLYAIVMLIKIYPFDFSLVGYGIMNGLFIWLFKFVTLALGIAFITNVVKTISNAQVD